MRESTVMARMRLPFLVVVAASAMIAAGVTAWAPPAHAAVIRRAPAAVSSAADPAEAAQLAVSEGQPVVVDSLTTPTEQTTALPDGTMQYQVSSVPVRAMVAGAWVPVDTTLQQDAGWLVPTASARPVRFSTGGSDVLDQVQAPGGGWVTETWPYGALPAPEVSGSTATYANVLPDVDLKLTATDLGLASVFVINSAAAMASPTMLAGLHLQVSGATLSQEASGVVTADTGTGSVLTEAAPLWWDSSDGGTFQGPGGDDPEMPVTNTSIAGAVTMNVAGSVAAQPVTYPVFVDPEWSSGDSASWYTDAAYPDTSYLSAGSSDVLRVGIYPPYKSDMFFQFPISAMAGKKILSAQLGTTQVSTDACPTSPIDVHTYGPKTPGFTWNQEQSWTGQWGPILDSQSPGGCTTSPMTVGWNVTAGVQQKLGQSLIQFAFTFHTATAWSRRHYSRAATLTVSYDSFPNTPASPSFVSPARACSTSSGAPVVFNGNEPMTVSVKQTDPDPGNVGADFYLQNMSTNTQLAEYTSPLQSQSTAIDWHYDASSLTPGTLYAWRARGADGTTVSSAYSPWCYFTVDNTSPAAPTVSTTASSFTVGHPVSVSLSGTTDVVGYEYWVAPGAPTATAPPAPVLIDRTEALPACPQRSEATRFACGTGTTPVSVQVAPVDGLSTLWVAAYDAAGNVSASTGLPLYTSVGAPAADDPEVNSGHEWQTTAMVAPLPNPIPDANTALGAGALSLTLPTDGGTWQTTADLRPGFTVPVLSPHEPADPSQAIITDSAPVDASNSFTVSMWVDPGTTDPTEQLVTALSDGQTNVELYLNGGVYQFCVYGTAGPGDDPSLVSNCATAPTATTAGTWTLVTGIWDAANQQLRLVLGDSVTPVAVTAHLAGTGGTASGGDFVIDPAPVSLGFTGLIANPTVVPGVLDSNQLAALINFASPFSD